MDAIEKAIRNAFEKGNAEDRAFREKVYRSAFAALDRALQANPSLTVEAAINRRKAMQAKITEIESEFQPAAAARAAPEPSAGVAPEVAADGSVAPEPRIDGAPDRAARTDSEPIAVAKPGGEPRFDVSVEPERRGAAEPSARAPEVSFDRRAEPRVSAPTPDIGGARSPTLPGDAAAEVAPDRDERRARRRRLPFAQMFLAATVLAAIGIGGWWAFQTGLLKTPAERDTTVPNPPATVESEDFIPEAEAPPLLPGQADAERDWITVFSPENASQVAAPADTSAEVMEDDSGSFLRIRSGESGSAIVFDVGQGILEQIAGKKATFDIVARAEEGQETEMSVDCNFGELGDCGRRRYAVGYQRGDYLFELDFPNASPGSGGTIAINSDFSNQGKAVDIYAIRVSVAE
ncbi:hypothetical protein [Mesorhizobium sp. WSM2239]|uniref:Biotin transporter BioY n=2 Tax=unclassified Mesorhizobium TaxID=325217 RepID=A0AAU8D7G2_9HYPH